MVSLFQQFPRILHTLCNLEFVVDLRGKFIQNAKGENPKPMAVEGERKKKPNSLHYLYAFGFQTVHNPDALKAFRGKKNALKTALNGMTVSLRG